MISPVFSSSLSEYSDNEDPVTGEVVPTNRHQKRKTDSTGQSPVSFTVKNDGDETRTDQARILELEEQVSKLQKQKEELLKELDLLAARYRD